MDVNDNSDTSSKPTPVIDKNKKKDSYELSFAIFSTTGSTVNECAKVLRRAGAQRIKVFTLARAI